MAVLQRHQKPIVGAASLWTTWLAFVYPLLGIFFLASPFKNQARSYEWAFKVLPEKAWAITWLIMGVGLVIGKIIRSRWAIRLSLMYSMWTQFVFAFSIALYVIQENAPIGGLAGAVNWFSGCLISGWILSKWSGDHTA